jgi:hypothetical protein
MTFSSVFMATALLVTSGGNAARTPTPNATPQKSDGPRIVVEPEGHDFGRVLQYKTLAKSFQIHNVGNKDLTLEPPMTSCGCTAALVETNVIKPGDSAPLKVELKTGGASGRIEKSVYIRSNDPSQKNVQVRISATVVEEKK